MKQQQTWSAVVLIDGEHYRCHHDHRSEGAADVCRERVLGAVLNGKLPRGIDLIPMSKREVQRALMEKRLADKKREALVKKLR